MKATQPDLILTNTSEGNVGAALNLLREALGEEEHRIRWEGSQAMAKGDYVTARVVIEFAERLLAFTDKVESLGSEWQSLEDLRDKATPEVQQIVSKRFFGRQPKGEVTPQSAFWKEISECFPDSSTEWQQFREAAYEKASHANEGPKEKSAYTLFVLSAVFDRQITTFYEPIGRYTMPYDAMVWGINSTHRLQMMSVLLQMCCGDWVCSVDDGLPRRLLWSHRIAASANPWRLAEDGEKGLVPQPSTAHKFFCNSSACRHVSEHSALWDIGHALRFEENVLNRCLRKMGWWFNGVLDETMHRHFRCKCQTMMAPRPGGNSHLNFFSCPRSPHGGHDTNVYLSWCAGSHCNHTIDSRVENKKCGKGRLICKECGSCCPEHMQKIAYSADEAKNEMWMPACHACSRGLMDAWDVIKQGTIPSEGRLFDCAACGAKNRVYPSREAFWKGKSAQSADRPAVQWNMLNQWFQYNTRPADTKE